MNNQFNELMETYFNTLNQFIPVVARVHGGKHPEFQEVLQLFNQIDQKIKEAGVLELEEFARLREVTNNYAIPEDVCVSYVAVYKLLAEIDQAYQAI